MRATLFLIAVGCALQLRADEGLIASRVFMGRERLSTVDNATKVEACILSVVDPSHGKNLYQREFVEGRFKTLPEEAATLVIWKLLDERSYTWDALPACIPTYNARLRFTSGSQVTEVDFCFGCGVILVRDGGKTVGGGYFSAGSDWVFRAIAEQFPRDPSIKMLWKEREARQHVQLQLEMAVAREERKKRANQPSEPTAMSVTPPAAQEPRQP